MSEAGYYQSQENTIALSLLSPAAQLAYAELDATHLIKFINALRRPVSHTVKRPRRRIRSYFHHLHNTSCSFQP